MCVLGIEPGSSEIAASVLNFRTISLAPQSVPLKGNRPGPLKIPYSSDAYIPGVKRCGTCMHPLVL